MVFRELYRQVPPLMRKNFLIWSASPRLLIVMLTCAVIAVFGIFIVVSLSSEDQTVITIDQLFPSDRLNLGPSGICEYFQYNIPRYKFVTTPGDLADQLQFNLQSLNFDTSSPFVLDIVDGEFTERGLIASQQRNASYNPLILQWHIEDDSNQPPYSHYSKLTSIPPAGNYKYFLYRTSSGSDYADSSLSYFYNKYENNRFLFGPSRYPILVFNALVELSIAQLNGFYPNTPICSFPKELFHLDLVPYPASYTIPHTASMSTQETLTISIIGFGVALLFFTPIVIFVSTTTLAERANHISASLLIIGISPLSTHIAGLLSHLVIFTPGSLFLWTIAYSLGLWNAFFLFLFYFAIIMALVTFSRLLSAFFKSLVTSQIASVSIVTSLFATALISLGSSAVFFNAQFFANFSLTIWATYRTWLWVLTRTRATVNFHDLVSVLPTCPVSLLGCIGIIVAQSIGMLLLGVYFDSIIQTSQYHIPKHWAFPLTDFITFLAQIFRCKLSQQAVHEIQPLPNLNNSSSSSLFTDSVPLTPPLSLPQSPLALAATHNQSQSQSQSQPQPLSSSSSLFNSISSSTSTNGSLDSSIASSTSSLGDSTPSNPFHTVFSDENNLHNQRPKKNPFDAISKRQQRYFLQSGDDLEDRLHPHEEYLFQGLQEQPHQSHQSHLAQSSTSGHNLFRSQPRSQINNKSENVNLGFFQSMSNQLSNSLNLFSNNSPSTMTTPLLDDQDVDSEPTDNNNNNNNNNKENQHNSFHPIIQFPSQSEQDNPSITLKNITKTYTTSKAFGLIKDEQTALDGVNMRFYRGQIHSLLSKNAGGKSTLLNIIGQLVEPSSGSVFLHVPHRKSAYSDEDSTFINRNDPYENPLAQYRFNKSLSNAESKQIHKGLYKPTYGICWQEDTLFEELTCFQNLELFSLFKESVSGLDLTREQRLQEIYQFLDLAQLGPKDDNKESAIVSSLSGGQRRKLNLACCLLHNPQIILLDHCTNGADVTSQACIWNMLELQKKKRTIILATHNFAEALIGDRISILREGQLVCSGNALFLKEQYNVGEYIFTIEKETFISLTADFEHESEKKQNSPPSQTPDQLSLSLTSFTDQTSSDPDDDVPMLTVDLHQELMTTRIEHIGFNPQSMLRLISDSHLTLTYAIQPQYEADIPLLLDYLEQHKDRLWIRGTSLTTTSLDDVFRRAHQDRPDESTHFTPPSHNPSPQQHSGPSSTPTPLLLSQTPITSTNQPRALKPVATKPISPLPTPPNSPNNFFADSNTEWYRTELPRVNSRFQLFCTLFAAFLKKRILMILFHLPYAIPLMLGFVFVSAIPILLFFSYRENITRIEIDLDEIHTSGGLIQYFTPPPQTSTFSTHFLASQNTTSNNHQHLHSNMSTFPPSSPQLHFSPSELLQQPLQAIAAGEPIHNWFSRSLTTSWAQNSQVPNFSDFRLSPHAAQKHLFDQSLASERQHPYALSTSVNNVFLLLNDTLYHPVGEQGYNDPDIPQQTSQLSTQLGEKRSGLFDLSVTMFLNQTSLLVGSGYVSHYFSILAELHNNADAIFTPTATTIARSQIPTSLWTLDTFPNTHSPTPVPSTIRPGYKSTISIGYLRSVSVELSYLLAMLPAAVCTLLSIIIIMFIIYTHHKEYSLKVFDLHKLAGGNLAVVAYHCANMLFDSLTSIVLLNAAYMLIFLLSRLATALSAETISYLPYEHLRTAMFNLLIYLTVVGSALPFQAYIAVNLFPESLISSYLFTLFHTVSPFLWALMFKIAQPNNELFFFLMTYLCYSPTSILVIATARADFAFWIQNDYQGSNFSWLILIFDYSKLLPIVTIALGIAVVAIAHVDLQASSFWKKTGSHTSSIFAPDPIRPFNHNIKTDPSALEMKRNIIGMRSRTGPQGHNQYALTLYGLRKVFQPPKPFILVRFMSFLKECCNPLLYWWRSRPQLSTKRQQMMEAYRLKLMRRQKRAQRRVVASLNPNTPEVSDDSDDEIEDSANLRALLNNSESLANTTVALNDLFLAVRRNSVFCLCAGNGHGKSTAFTILTNELKPSSSNDPLSTHVAFLDNTNLITNPSGVFSKVSYCPQSNRLNLELSARQQFELYATLYGIVSDAHEYLIDRVLFSLELTEVADEPCSRYSPGQRRLVQIGISLLCNSEILLLDEFSNFLDPITRSNVHKLLKALAHTRTIILASHLAEEIEQLSDDIGIICRGSLITVGSKSMLKAGESSNAEQLQTKSTLYYTINVRVESLGVIMPVQSFLLSSLARIPPPSFESTDTSKFARFTPQQHKERFQRQLVIWNQWLKKCSDAGVKIVAQRQNRFTLHVNIDLFPLSTLFTRLETCKVQCSPHLVRYTASQPNVDQLFIKVLEQSNKIAGESHTRDNFDLSSNAVI